MPDTPYSNLRPYAFGGPTDSADYNAQVEERFRDLVALYNGANQLAELVDDVQRRYTKESNAFKMRLEALSARIAQLEADNKSFISIKGAEELLDNDAFIGTAFEISETDACSYDSVHGILTTPIVAAASSSAMFLDDISGPIVPDSFDARVVGVDTSADGVGAVIDSTLPAKAVGRRRGENWERNVIVDSSDSDGAIMNLYIKIPQDVSPNANINYLTLHAYPALMVDILEISYTTDVDLLMNDTDNYSALNLEGIYEGSEEAVGYVPPGSWDGDEDLSVGLRTYYFSPKPITGFRIKFRQRNYYRQADQYVYTYGANFIDCGFNKSLDSGKTIVRFDIPDDYTISSVDNVVPNIFNVPESEIPDIFSYRAIWETAFDSGIYTTTPVALSTRVWIEVTLNKSSDGTIPVLSGLHILTDAFDSVVPDDDIYPV